MKPNKNVKTFWTHLSRVLYPSTCTHTYTHTNTLVSKSWRLTGMFHDWKDIYIKKSTAPVRWSSVSFLTLSLWFPLSLWLSLTHSLSSLPVVLSQPSLQWCAAGRAAKAWGWQTAITSIKVSWLSQSEPIKWNLPVHWGFQLSPLATGNGVEEEGWVDVAWDSSVAFIKLLASRWWNRWL